MITDGVEIVNLISYIQITARSVYNSFNFVFGVFFHINQSYTIFKANNSNSNLNSKSRLFQLLHIRSTKIQGTETLLGLFAPIIWP